MSELIPMLRLLNNSWQDICFKYDGLTQSERDCLTQDEFNDILSEMTRHGLELRCIHGYNTLAKEYVR